MTIPSATESSIALRSFWPSTVHSSAPPIDSKPCTSAGVPGTRKSTVSFIVWIARPIVGRAFWYFSRSSLSFLSRSSVDSGAARGPWRAPYLSGG